VTLIDKSELEVLAAQYGGPCVSLYMPTHRAGPDVQQDAIRLRNLADQTEEPLAAAGMRTPDIRTLLGPVRELEVSNTFWQHQADGLAVFVSDALMRCYRLPLRFEELVTVSDRFLTKPLLPALSRDARFFILALSQGSVRLLRGTQYSVAPVTLGDVPRSLDEALRYEDPETHLQWHMGERADPRTGHEAMFHGHGFLSADDSKERILRFFHKLDVGICEVLGENRRAPVVLAGVDYLLPIYREASNPPTLVDDAIEGNPDALGHKELYEAAWRIVEPIFTQEREQAAALYERLAGQEDERACADVRDAVIAAYEGRVDTLFVATDVQRWGTYAPEDCRVEEYWEPAADRHNLLDLAAVYTLSNDGEVYAAEAKNVPGPGPLAAILRY